MKVWIDQELCTGAATCESEVPEVFEMSDDGLAYVKDDGQILKDAGAKATVPSELEDAVRDMVEECPAECIFVGD